MQKFIDKAIITSQHDSVLLQLVDILNTVVKYWVGYRQVTFITEMFELSMKSCAKKFYLLFVNIQSKWDKGHFITVCNACL